MKMNKEIDRKNAGRFLYCILKTTSSAGDSQKALALPRLFIRAKRGTRPFANNKIHAINTAIDIYYFNSGRAIIASGRFFDEPIGSACGMPQGGRCKPPARPVVMTILFRYSRRREC